MHVTGKISSILPAVVMSWTVKRSRHILRVHLIRLISLYTAMGKVSFSSLHKHLPGRGNNVSAQLIRMLFPG